MKHFDEAEISESQQNISCWQKFKTKLKLIKVLVQNYLQCDRLVSSSSQQCKTLFKKKPIKKYSECYQQTYSQRQENFQYSFQQIEEVNNAELINKKKNFCQQFRRLVCCLGGNHTREIQEDELAEKIQKKRKSRKKRDKGQFQLQAETIQLNQNDFRTLSTINKINIQDQWKKIIEQDSLNYKNQEKNSDDVKQQYCLAKQTSVTFAQVNKNNLIPQQFVQQKDQNKNYIDSNRQIVKQSKQNQNHNVNGEIVDQNYLNVQKNIIFHQQFAQIYNIQNKINQDSEQLQKKILFQKSENKKKRIKHKPQKQIPIYIQQNEKQANIEIEFSSPGRDDLLNSQELQITYQQPCQIDNHQKAIILRQRRKKTVPIQFSNTPNQFMIEDIQQEYSPNTKKYHNDFNKKYQTLDSKQAQSPKRKKRTLQLQHQLRDQKFETEDYQVINLQ